MTLDWQGAVQAVIYHPLFGVGITLAVYQLSLAAYEKTRWVFLQPVLVSMAAGVTIAALEQAAPGCPILRIMPNTACAVGAVAGLNQLVSFSSTSSRIKGWLAVQSSRVLPKIIMFSSLMG